MVGSARAFVSAALLGSAVAAACDGGLSGPPPTPVGPENGAIHVYAAEWRFDPSRIVLRRGEQVRIDLQNEGQILHVFKIDALQADVAGSNSTGPLSGQGELFVGAAAGQGGTLVFTPRETGSFTYYCSIPRHRQLGMKGTIFVQ